jgi:deoxyribonucleoside regulator
VARLGRILGGRGYYLHAPMLVTDVAVRNGLLRDQHIRKTLEMARRANVLLVSVGAISRGSGLYRAGYLNEADLEYIEGQGAVGDICGSYFKRDGSPCSIEFEERMIAVSAEVMRTIPLRVGVGWGGVKALPSLGAVRAGLIDVLVIDEEAGMEIVRLVEQERAATPPTAIAGVA